MNDYIIIGHDAKDITGSKFGQLIVLGPIGRKKGGIVWLCCCECGKEARISGELLRSGRTKSCGCLQKSVASKRLKTHGMSHTKLFVVWGSIIKRCENQASRSFPDYGGRGIKICDEWRYDFLAFHNYVVQLPNYGENGYTLDRIDNNGNYEPGNLRWSTQKEQCRNTRKNILLTHDGKTQCVAAWAEELGVSVNVLHHRLYAGWSTEETLSAPVRTHDVLLTHNGKAQTTMEWAAELGISLQTLRKRLKMGWGVERALSTPIDSKRATNKKKEV